MELYKSTNVTVEHLHDKGIQIHRCSEGTSSMTDEAFKSDMLIVRECVEKHSPRAIMVQAQKLNFVVIPEVQEWIDTNIAPVYLKVGVTMFAYIMPRDIFQQVALEQMMDEGNAKNFGTRYFDNEEEGLKWLLKS